MTIYTVKNNKLEEIHEQPFKLEREIQTLFEANLNEVMGLKLVRSEFSIKNRRIDTLAFDEQAKAFIIIEYKRDKNISVVDQGFTYLGLMLENKADFVLEHQSQLNSTLKITDVDWSQTKVVFFRQGLLIIKYKPKTLRILQLSFGKLCVIATIYWLPISSC